MVRVKTVTATPMFADISASYDPLQLNKRLAKTVDEDDTAVFYDYHCIIYSHQIHTGSLDSRDIGLLSSPWTRQPWYGNRHQLIVHAPPKPCNDSYQTTCTYLIDQIGLINICTRISCTLWHTVYGNALRVCTWTCVMWVSELSTWDKGEQRQTTIKE